MIAVTVLLALLAALANASASVLQRRAAVQETDRGGGSGPGILRRIPQLLRRRSWRAGTAMLVLSGLLQAGALATGSLSLVQPLLAAELLFTLAVGSVVFRRRPDARTWLAFVALAGGLALFLLAAAPSVGRDTARPGAWLLGGGGVLGAVALLWLAARPVRGACRALLLGLASALCFATTAALMKEAVGRLADGPAAMLGHWSPYATGAAGLVAFVLLQGALAAGPLTASQPALTLGDALGSVILGWVLFAETVQLGLRMLPEAAGVALIGAGSIGLARAPSVGGEWDTGDAATRPGSTPAVPRTPRR